MERQTDESRGSTMHQSGLEKALRGLGMFTGVAYLIVGVAGAIWPGHWDEAAASDRIIWAVLLILGGLLVLGGLRLLYRSPARGGTLVSIGAVVGALPIFWALLPLLLAVALIVLSVLYARRTAQSRHAAVSAG
jgi:hypothetical protein